MNGIPGAHGVPGLSQQEELAMHSSHGSKMTATTEDFSVDPSSAPPTIPLESDYFSPRIPEPGRKPWVIPVALMAVTAVLAVVIPVAVVMNKKQENVELTPHTFVPLPEKDNITLEELNLLVPGLGKDTLERICADDLSPQRLALDWVRGDPYDWDGYDDRRKLQRYVLSVIFYALNGIGWAEYTNLRWNKHHIHECDYAAIVRPRRKQLCDNQEQVVAIDLSNLESLKGSFPPEIALLPNLHIIDFSKSMLGEDLNYLFKDLLKVDKDLSKFFPSLRTLLLSDNEVVGTLPSALGTISSLQHLQITDNRNLKGSIPSEFGQLSHLGFLALFQNDLTGDIPREVGEIPHLAEFIVSGNQLNQQPLPNTFCRESHYGWVVLATDWCTGVEKCCAFYDEEEDLEETYEEIMDHMNSTEASQTEEASASPTPDATAENSAEPTPETAPGSSFSPRDESAGGTTLNILDEEELGEDTVEEVGEGEDPTP